MDKSNQNLYVVLQRGDRMIAEAHEEAIILVGLTRAGKSTTFNWILNKGMRGQGKLHSHYVNIVKEDGSAAELGNSYTSVTLAPNVHKNFTQSVSLIDMAGYFDKRDFVGVIGVSYFLKALFERVRKVKFLIVFDQHRFIEETGDGIIKTFTGFLNMFNIDKMDAQMKQKLIQSVGVIVTRSKHGEEHYQYMNEVVRRLSDKGLNVPNRQIIVQMLQKLCNDNRVQQFKAAVNDRNPQECKFIDRFNNQLHWQYFNLDDIQSKLQDSVISLPFTKDFNQLPQGQQNEFKVAVDKRVKSYTEFADIIKVMITTFKQNWEGFLKTYQEDGKVQFNHYQMKPLFERIRQFLKVNDVYNSKTLIQDTFQVSYEPMTLIQAIQKVLDIYKIVERIGGGDVDGAVDLNAQFKDIMANFTLEFMGICDAIGTFASNNEQKQEVKQLNFVLKRGFREFQKLYELQQSFIHDIKQKLPDCLNLVLQEDKKLFVQSFIKGLNSNIFPKVFNTEELIGQYELFFAKYQENYPDQHNSLFCSQVRCNLEMSKAYLMVQAGKKNEALHCYIEAFRNYKQIGIQISNNNEMSEENKEEEIDKIYMKKIQLIRLISDILKTLSKTPNFVPKNTALMLCQRFDMIQDARELFEFMISESESSQRKCELYKNYAQYLAKWGLIDDAVKLLFKKMKYEEGTFSKVKETAKNIHDLRANKEMYGSQAQESFSNWKRIQEEEDFEAVLAELAINVPKNT